MSSQPTEKSSFFENYAFAQGMARFPALTVMVLLRKDVGFRLLNPLALLATTGALALLALLAMSGNNDPGPSLLLLFAVMAFVGGLSQRARRWKELNHQEPTHSYYIGTSPFDFQWLPDFCRRHRRMARFADPFFCAVVGVALFPFSSLLALWLVFAGVCLRVYEDAVFRRERNRDLDLIDSLIISGRQTEMLDQYHQAPALPLPPDQGIPAGLGPDIQEAIRRRRMKPSPGIASKTHERTTQQKTTSRLPPNTAN